MGPRRGGRLADLIAVVVPSNRPDSLRQWAREWVAQIRDLQARVYVVHDVPETWAEIRDTLKASAWIIPVQTDCIRAYGYWQAWRDGATHILTLDDDCYPGGALADHVTALDTVIEPDGWTRTIPEFPTRGLPLTRRIGLNHGLWTEVPDVSGAYQLAHGVPPSYSLPSQILTVGTFAPISGMNLAWRAEVTPLLYFTLQGTDIRDPARRWGVDRFGDIFAGILAKRACDHLGIAVRSGTPWVRHSRASDPTVNAAREVAGTPLVPALAAAVRGIRLTADTPVGVYRQLADGLAYRHTWYFRTLSRAMHVWADLFA